MLRKSSTGRVVGFCAVLTLVLAFIALPVQAKMHEGEAHEGSMMKAGEVREATPCPMCTMWKDHQAMVNELQQVLEEAHQAAEEGDADQAAEKIAEAQEMVQEREKMMMEHQKMHPGMGRGRRPRGRGMGMGMRQQKMECPMCGAAMEEEEMKVVNQRCPISGKKIDPDGVSSELTREFQGQKVGFCCPACPPKWEEMTEEEKEEALENAMK